MANFDLSKLALKATCPTNDLLYDDKDQPSVMVFIPKFKISDVITGGSSNTHPAFIINGQEVDGIYISKFLNVVNNGRAYSLPAEDPKASINLDTAISYCTSKGDGWHVMTRAEYAAIALWCKKNNTLPYGNNNYGKDSRESNYKAVVTYRESNNNARTATGTGPLTWSHDRTLEGIWDLNGNVWEWNGGVRTVKGEVQVLANNNAADLDNSQSASSAQWKAIDATTGAFITPNGTGTTANSIKMDWKNSTCTYSTTIATQSDTARSTTFQAVTCDTSVAAAAQEVLKALALMPADSSGYEDDGFYFNNGADERAFCSGGGWVNGAAAGVFCLSGYNPRSTVGASFGFRSAFVKLPTA